MSTQTITRGPWACPEAERLLPADAPREQWLTERRRGIGGSDASTIAGVNRWGSRYELWLDKTGRLPDQGESDAMLMGRLLEPVVRGLFEERTGIKVRRAGLMAHRGRSWQRVSPDGLTEDGGLFEAKTTNWRLAEEWEDDQVADHAEVQVQHGLAVTGRSHAWVAVLVDGRRFEFRRVERDERLIEVLTGMESSFWHDHVLTDVAPPMEPNALAIVKELYPEAAPGLVVETDRPDLVRDALARRSAGKAMEKNAKELIDVAEAELIAEIGDAEALTIDGRTVFTRPQNGTFAAARFTAAHPDVAAEFMTKPALDVDALKAAHPELYAQFRARVLRPTKEK